MDKSLGTLLLEYGLIGLAVGCLEAMMFGFTLNSYAWLFCPFAGLTTGLVLAAKTRNDIKRKK